MQTSGARMLLRAQFGDDVHVTLTTERDSNYAVLCASNSDRRSVVVIPEKVTVGVD